MDDFTIICNKCGSDKVVTQGTAINYGNKVRVQFRCEICNHIAEVLCVSIPFAKFSTK